MGTQTRVEKSLAGCPKLTKPAVLTIGTFDGVHLGHQAVLQKVKEQAAADALKVAITFSNHPSEVLRPAQRAPFLISPRYKVHLLKKQGLDLIFLLPFTRALSLLSAEQFLQEVRSVIPLNHLVLGYNARIGYEQEADAAMLAKIGKRLGFSVSQLDPYKVQDQIVSSSRIRSLLRLAKLDEAARLLGRPVSYFGIAEPGQGIGKTLGFPTLNLNLTELCTPPHGVYAVQAVSEKHTLQGIANLGLAPTLRQDRLVLLETHLFAYTQGLESQEIEVQLAAYLRPEKKFASISALRNQIAQDITAARNYHKSGLVR